MSEVRVYRLIKRKWLASAFNGEGAKRFGGRWNSRGRRCTYVSRSESLALLEMMVHLDDYRVLRHYSMLQLTLASQDILQLPQSHLPADWRDEPAPDSTADIGDAWLAQGVSLALAVPSVIVPRECNVLLNPEHAAYQRVVASAVEVNFDPDPRFYTQSN